MSSAATVNVVTGAVREAAWPLAARAGDYDPLLERIGDASFVLIGEGTHGTEEFYMERAEITRRLIVEKNFNAVAVESDWLDACPVNEYVRGEGDPKSDFESLAGFRRFQAWMWRNYQMVNFVSWMRSHNDALPGGQAKVGFYGLDLYGLHASLEAVIRYLDNGDPDASRRARDCCSCIERFGDHFSADTYTGGFGLTASRENELVNQLVERQRHASEHARRDPREAADEFFFEEQNARLILNAGAYYRSMLRGGIPWRNLHSRHIAETIEALEERLKRQYGAAKIVVWQHNSLLGDARATQRGRAGELSVGQLVRERYGDDSVLIGFFTYAGTVSAASTWDGAAERERVAPAIGGSYESLFHDVGLPRFLLVLRPGERAALSLSEPRLERSIGAIYRPESERGAYFEATLSGQFDAILHFDETSAIVPLDRCRVAARGGS